MKPQIPWLRVFVEGVVIVGSILLAFGIQAWWDGQQERADETQILVSLRDELRENQERLEGSAAFSGALQEAAYIVLQSASEPGLELSPDSVDSLLATLTWWVVPDWVTATVDALVSSGDIVLISDQRLRARLGSWTRRIERVIDLEEQEAFTYHERWLPYLIRTGYISQLANLQRVQPGSSDPWPAYREMPLVSPRTDHSALMEQREFQNLVQVRHWDHQDLRVHYGLFAADLNQLLDQVEAELAR